MVLMLVTIATRAIELVKGLTIMYTSVMSWEGGVFGSTIRLTRNIKQKVVPSTLFRGTPAFDLFGKMFGYVTDIYS